MLLQKIRIVLIICLLALSSAKSYSWGNKGHKIVADIAYACLNQSTRDSVKKYLGEMSFQNAATWMDDVRKDSTYNYMKPWHYINIEKDQTYVKTPNENIINELTKVIEELQNGKHVYEQSLMNIKILFHLVGDLHQPLHNGYGIDKGGNSIEITFLGKRSNLHKVWDTEIINEKNITTENCLKLAAKLSKRQVKKLQKTDVVKWMNESRMLMKNAYDFKDGIIDQNYIDKNTPVIEKQLIIAGIRLAGILEKSFSK